MKKILNSNFVFIALVVAYLLTRQWPFGSWTQTVADVFILITVIVRGATYFQQKKR